MMMVDTEKTQSMAKAEAQAKAKADPKAAQACLAKGNRYHLEGQYQLSLREYKRALELYEKLSKNAAYHLNVGVVFYDDGQFEKSLDCFRKSLSIKPRNAMAHCNIGNVLKMQGKLEAALKEYRLSYELSKKNVIGHTSIAQSPKGATSMETVTVERNSWNGLVGCLISLDLLEEALDETNTKLSNGSDNFDALCLKVLVLAKLKREDSKECEQAVCKVLEHYYHSQETIKSQRGNNSQSKDKFAFDLDDEKRHLFGFVLSKCALSKKRHTENNIGSNNNDGHNDKQQRNRETLELWQLACAMELSYGNLIHLGAEYERIGDLAAARNAYLTARKVCPENWGSHYRLGKLGFKLCKFDYAYKHLERSLKLAESTVSSTKDNKARAHALSVISQLQVNLGIVLINAGKMDSAKHYLAIAAAGDVCANTNTVIANSLLAMVLIKEGNINDALITLVRAREQLTRVSSKVPSAAEIHFCIAILSQKVRIKNENKHEGEREHQPFSLEFEIQCLKEALRMDPNHKDAKTQLDKLVLLECQSQHQKQYNTSISNLNEDNLANRLHMSNKDLYDVDDFKINNSAFNRATTIGNSKESTKTKPELTKRPMITRMKSCPLPKTTTNTNSKDAVSSEKNCKTFLHSLKLRRSAISGDEASDDDGHYDSSEDSEEEF